VDHDPLMGPKSVFRGSRKFFLTIEIPRNVCFLTFLSYKCKAIWVAIDFRRIILVMILKRLRTTGLDAYWYYNNNSYTLFNDLIA